MRYFCVKVALGDMQCKYSPESEQHLKMSGYVKSVETRNIERLQHYGPEPRM
jgi:hypothetical protein